MTSDEKTVSRSDAWSPEDDVKLANLVLQHIRSGSTQLRAFDEAATLLGRTSAACGYRWNGVVRKHYRDEIEKAKEERKTSKVHSSIQEVETSDSNPHQKSVSQELSMTDILHFLQTYEQKFQHLQQHASQLENLNKDLANRIGQLEVQVIHPQSSSFTEISSEQLDDDSKTLFAILQRAKKILQDSH
ncbi:RsfA family transcriptional regulator [Alicyclobacillus tolerans]|uniref:Prespore-specific regulator n=1 Tax=Alicyclobacillus tolerans TaxID=90970 RepID=A0A1M6P4G2_9BACL|nr:MULTISPECIES: transcriptional regulator [Alicyclobacillus]QRF22672.1 RsfA family transcriptional regulator [Alicyclobacillus sp. TC]SHK02857.1 prespore-specific regulator [Alicyclobacillus montanus]